MSGQRRNERIDETVGQRRSERIDDGRLSDETIIGNTDGGGKEEYAKWNGNVVPRKQLRRAYGSFC